ncbi:BTAD domain-containing putative transcriptional regulator [Actinosynnema sp. NPDC047251]|uniref:Transcriptional regulator n=1 Tax=Saccharothrix espanaensis (strain ATCC 51144 / DSM 44229 / JCM 9112 / NBRC 15066 / NRRL 15764) TaxID=1179773 RepID=K0JUG9_SACES|nr:BTAD domain-containing putative transcriptional regulator [Saccharothrix espanaensis]CCH28454.1 Transcriptional regulator [Saccharothrix espanaensis DSM 44229]
MEFGLLGPVEAREGGRPVDVGHARQRAVLAALLLEDGRPVSVDRLVDRVWGERPPLRARDTLYGYVSKLRARIPIERRPAGYVLATQATDLHEFRELVRQARSAPAAQAAPRYDRALGLWRGEALAGLDSPWFAATRDALRAERKAVELDRNDVVLDLGGHVALLPELLARGQDDPVDERLAAQVITALHRAGRTSEALQHYEHLRRSLAEELGADPGPALRDLHRELLGPEPAVPRQLPAPQRWFTGREREIRELTDTGSTVVITAIGGAGGIGKTALALHWAHLHVEDFPDGQLYVNLRGFDPAGEPVAPGAALRGFLGALGVQDPPQDLDAQAALYRSLVADKRLLVVLDNARDSAQVAPLLPGGPRCTALITSRRQLLGVITEHGAKSVSLAVLDEPAARALLTSRLGDRVAAEPDVVRALLELCGGLPLALSIVAARAVTRPDLPLAVLAEELAENRLDALDDLSSSLRTVFACSLRVLSADAVGLFGLLGLTVAAELSLRSVAALAGLPVARTRALARELESAHLVQQHVPGRYRLHDLVRLYAAEVAPADDVPLRRFVGYFAATAYAGDRLIEPHRPPVDPPAGEPVALPDVPAAMAWFDGEYESLLAAQRQAVGRRWHDLVWVLAWALTNYHLRRGHAAEDLAVWREALPAAEALADVPKQVAAHKFVGMALVDVGVYPEGLAHLGRALDLVDDDYDRAGAHRAMAWGLERQGDLAGALAHADAQLTLFRTLGIPVRVAEALNDVGYRAAKLGDHARAEACCGEALALNRELGHRDGEAATSDSLGFIAFRHGRADDAVRHYRYALDLYRELDNSYEEASVLRHLGDVHADLGQPDDARACRRAALTLFEAQGRVEDAAEIAHLIG